MTDDKKRIESVESEISWSTPRPSDAPSKVPQSTTPKLWSALAVAQGQFPDIEKRRQAHVPGRQGSKGYSYKYADLADVIKAVAPILSANGLGFVQEVSADEVITTVFHQSGETFTARYPMRPMGFNKMDSAQGLQAAAHASKRYALQAALGISAEESIEGDPTSRRGGYKVDVDFLNEDGQIVMVKGQEMLAPDADRQARASAAAKGIIAQFEDAKTARGVNGAWERNEPIIERLRESYPDDYQNVLDAFTHNVNKATDAKPGA